MRDIRGDLQDRAGFLEEQIGAAQAQFEKRMELFTREHEAKIADLQAELEAVSMLMEREYRRIMTAPDVEEERLQEPPQAREQEPVAVAPEAYDEVEYTEGALEELPEEVHYREQAAAEPEPARRAEPVEEARPAPRETERQYTPRPAARVEEDRRPVTAEIRPRRPMPVERPVAERRPEPAPYRTAARAAEPRQEPARAEPMRREAQPRRYDPVQRDQGPAQAQRQPLADFLIRKLGEAGHMSLEDLCGVAIQEGYFAEGDNPDRTVHTTLMNVVKAGFIRQMPNGTFAPASVMDTIRLRRAI